MLLRIDAVLDLVELCDGHALIADLLEYLHRITDTALQQQPARALRHHEHANQSTTAGMDASASM